MSGIYKSLFQALGGKEKPIIVRSAKKDPNRYFKENISASLEIDTDFIEVFYANRSASENISASLGVTVSYTSA